MPGPLRYVIGGYTDGPGQGLGVITVEDGRLSRATLVAEANNPSYVITSPDGRIAYAVLERDAGAVAAWTVGDPDTVWVPLGEQQPTGGSAPCHLTLSVDGRFLISSNYESGSIAVHPVLDDGSLGARTQLVQHEGPTGRHSERQDGPHAHQVVVGPDGHYFACDLGLDIVFTYVLDASGQLEEVSRSAMPPGTGPRHLAFSTDGAIAWVVGELSSRVVMCSVAGPVLEPVSGVSTRAPHLQLENTPAAILVTPDGARVLVSNRGDDTVAVLDVESGSLRPETVLDVFGHWPRHIAWAPEGQLLVTNERSNVVVLLGGSTDRPGVAPWPSPTCLAALA